MLPKQFQDLLEKFSRGVCSPEEERLITEWYSRLGQNDGGTLPDTEKAQVEERLWAAINPEARKKRSLVPQLVRAAIIILPILAGTLFYLIRQPFSENTSGPHVAGMEQSDTRISNDGDTPRTITLSDGSEVILQPSSQIILGDDFGVYSRSLQLKGEAFFEVKRDEERPFVVYSNEVVTRVLGTSFSVRAYEDDGEITVAVRSGKVSVYTNKKKTRGRAERDGDEVILTPNQQMVYHRAREQVSKRLVEKPEVIMPNSNLFRMQFENAAVSTIFEVLEENYGIEIRYDKTVLDNCRLTTTMSDEGLYERIEVICKAIGASYAVDNDAVITIKSNGC